MGTTLKIILLAALAAVFVWLWRKGHFLRLTKYVQETREELHKCTWPSREELKGSTVVVLVATLLLGGYTVGVDTVLWLVFQLITAA